MLNPYQLLDQPTSDELSPVTLSVTNAEHGSEVIFSMEDELANPYYKQCEEFTIQFCKVGTGLYESINLAATHTLISPESESHSDLCNSVERHIKDNKDLFSQESVFSEFSKPNIDFVRAISNLRSLAPYMLLEIYPTFDRDNNRTFDSFMEYVRAECRSDGSFYFGKVPPTLYFMCQLFPKYIPTISNSLLVRERFNITTLKETEDQIDLQAIDEDKRVGSVVSAYIRNVALYQIVFGDSAPYPLSEKYYTIVSKVLSKLRDRSTNFSPELNYLDVSKYMSALSMVSIATAQTIHRDPMRLYITPGMPRIETDTKADLKASLPEKKSF